MAKSEFHFSHDMKKNLFSYLLDEFDKRADDIVDTIESFYLDEVNRFYNDKVFNGSNIPKYYRRHPYSSIENSGMAKTYQRYKKVKWHGEMLIISAGIILNTYQMYNDYSGQKDWVLYSFTQGYHGLPSQGIIGSVRPLIDTKKYIMKKIKKDFVKPIDFRNLRL